MKVIIGGTTVICRAAKKEDTQITLFLGRYDEFGNEETSVFVGFDPTDAVLDGGEWEESTPTEDEKRDAQIFYTAMMTDTLLEV